MKKHTKRALSKTLALIALFCMTTQPTFAALINLAQKPLFTGAPIPPKVMLAISKDQQRTRRPTTITAIWTATARLKRPTSTRSTITATSIRRSVTTIT